MMGETQIPKQKVTPRSQSHMPRDSVFFEKIVPVLLALMGLLTVGLIVFAAGIVTGLIKF